MCSRPRQRKAQSLLAEPLTVDSGVQLSIFALDTLPTSALWAADSVVGFCLLVMGTMGPPELHEKPIRVQCDEDVPVNALGFPLWAPITKVAAADGRQGAPDHRQGLWMATWNALEKHAPGHTTSARAEWERNRFAILLDALALQ